MPSTSENNKRIARNTLMLYFRMLFSMIVSLYTSRVVLNTLGVEDYGVYNVVGGFVAMFSLISGSLSSSVSRFLTFELGRGDFERLKRTFSTSLLIHIALAVIILVLMETVGIWFLNNKMTIPTSRLYAANWVFQGSILSFMLGLFSVPYNASIVAHERMSAFAYIGIGQVLLNLGIVLFIAYSPLSFDRLIVYALLQVAVGILIQAIYWTYCRKNFSECRITLEFDRKCWKEMGAFAGWNFIGCTAGLLKDQGVNVLLNLFIGPIVNAARGISGTVINAVSGFAGNFMVALNPQITKSYASGDLKYCHSLVERGSRFSFFILFIIALPVFLETEYILTLWLGQYPEHTINFLRLVLILSMIDVLSSTLINLQAATGQIRNYQIVVGGVLLLNFPLSYICLYFGCPPESTYIVAIFVALACLLLRLAFLRKMAQLSMRSFFNNVCLRIVKVVLLAIIIPILLHYYLQYGLIRFFIVGISCVISSVIVIYYVGCSLTERQFILSKAITIKDKFIK